MDALAERRLEVVRRHVESENEHDFDATIATFVHPRYELIPTGQVFDGEDEVRMVAFFEFAPADGNRPDGIVCERVYYDLHSILHQLGLA